MRPHCAGGSSDFTDSRTQVRCSAPILCTDARTGAPLTFNLSEPCTNSPPRPFFPSPNQWEAQQPVLGAAPEGKGWVTGRRGGRRA